MNEKSHYQTEKNIAVDLDGVIFENLEEWKGLTHFGAPVADVREALGMLKGMGYNIIIYTCRTNEMIYKDECPDCLIAWVKKALDRAQIPYDDIEIFGKPQAEFYIDDRAIRFTTWQQTVQEILLRSITK